MPVRVAPLRLIALIAPTALVLHQLRYLLAYGGHAEHELAAQGHGYLATVTPLIGLVLAAGLASAVCCWAGRREDAHRHVDRRRLAVVLATGLLAVFSVQELLEGALAGGHAAGVAALVAGGGWTALPLAALLGTALAFVVSTVEQLADERVRLDPPALPALLAVAIPAPPSAAPPQLLPLAFAPGRGPPLLTV